MSQIDKALRSALNEVFNPSSVDKTLEKVNDESSVRDLRRELDFDSLDEIEFIMALEEALDVEISDEEAERFLSPEMTIAKLKARLQAKVDQG